ncbi:MAG: endolytic transglycosylase MltG [Proteobacteria bacterium]|nr:endolytic transglycosylase MltG [Pseudomonadota bacterium]MBU1584115.1 endolytic transglycosylase MltG [Pseudomonadota bacterium]MBU2455337.1 endolytic transglycosylase MltG [Pseudomonadota bacterium]MBU2628971.1 endolytic transglycosylase MltG [Pseudomonadota bacterium]
MTKNKLKTLSILFLILILFLLVVGGILFFKMSSFIKAPFNPVAAEIIFNIDPGQSLKMIARNLEKESIISNQTYFQLFVKFKKAGKKLQAGEYLLSASKSPEQILGILVKGKVKLYRITIVEGRTIKEIAQSVEAAGLCTEAEFLALCHDPSFILFSGIKSTSLEGYLFPDTYFFPRHTSCEHVITTMVEHFKTVFSDDWRIRAEMMGFTVHDIVTLASIIEKETGDASERPIISSVFHNRLKKNMRLESDPTVIYGIKDFDGNIKRKHLKMITPYNTYQITGLPAGPIANPGALSLKAALYPDQTEYLFFVSKKDTTHKFSKTIQEHNLAVKKFQLRQ